MDLQDKRQQFLDGTLRADRQLSASDLAGIGAGQAAFLKGVLFERGAGVGAPVLPAGSACFFGAYSYINSGGYLRDRVFVGRFSSIGRRVTIGAGNHFTTGLSTSPTLSGRHALDCYSPEEMVFLEIEPLARKNSVTEIGCDVWIGDGAVILPGLHIGHGAVIGANAVVTRDVPPYAVVGGVPARIIKHRFPPAQIHALLASGWWEHSHELLNTLPLGNVLGCLRRLQELGPPQAGGYETCECTG